MLLIAIGAYFQTWVDLWPYWDDTNATYTHGTLVAVVSVWLVWRARLTVNQIEAISNTRVLPVIIILSTAWVLAEKANVFILYVALWPLLVFSAIWAGFGVR
ncbi:MAG: archaeosortase/exosortase family protein, partial [Woeseiaceae bacterium]